MGKLILLEAVLVAFFILDSSAWAEKPPDRRIKVTELFPDSRSSLARLFTGNDGFETLEGEPFDTSLHLNLVEEAFKLKASYTGRQAGQENSNDLFGKAEWGGLLNFLATSSFFGGKLGGEGEIAYSLDGESAEGLGQRWPSLLRFGLKGRWGGFGYGAEYRSVERGFMDLTGSKVTSDQEGGQIWGARKFGPVRVKSSVSQFWNDVGGNPRRPRVTNSTTTTLHYSRSPWEATLSSTYSLINERFGPKKKSVVFFHELKGSYRPTNTVTGTTTFSLKREHDRLSGTRTKTPSVLLSFAYRPLRDVLAFTALGTYTGTWSSDRLNDTRVFRLTANMNWNLGTSPLGAKTLSFKFSYSRRVDVVAPDSLHNDFSMRLLLRITSF